jgi:hypothetical protein
MRKITVSVLMIGLCATASVRAAEQPDLSQALAAPDAPLTLRVNDAVVENGGLAAAVIRTYRSRGVGSGQLCFAVHNRAQAGARAEAGPQFTYVAAQVFDPARQVQSQMIREPDEVMLTFSAPNPTINSVDGPLAVLYFRVTGAQPGDQFDMEPLLDSYLIDGDGNEIPLDLRPGRLKIADPGQPFEVAGAADTVVPGGRALLSVQTKQLEQLSSGTLALRYDPRIAAAAPTIRVDPRHGKVTYDTDGSSPEDGLIVIHFTSPGSRFNRVPGDLLEVTVPTRPGIAPGRRSVVRPEEALTVLFDADGQVMPLEFESDTLQFVPR